MHLILLQRGCLVEYQKEEWRLENEKIHDHSKNHVDCERWFAIEGVSDLLGVVQNLA